MAEQQAEELTAEIGGQKLTYRGFHFGNLLQILLVAAVIGASYLLVTARAEQKAEHGTMAQVLLQQSKLLERQAVAQEEFNYIVTLSSADRERLNLRMPESLRVKLGTFR